MGEFVRVAAITDVEPGHGIVAEVNGKTLAFSRMLKKSASFILPSKASST